MSATVSDAGVANAADRAFRAAVERAYGGPLSTVALASAIVGSYSGVVYLTPIAGGIIADRWLGGLLERTPGTRFWLLHAGLVSGAALSLLVAWRIFGHLLAPTRPD